MRRTTDQRSSRRGASFALCRVHAAALLLAAGPGAAATQELPTRYMLIPAASHVGFNARATLGSFRGTAHDVVGWAQLSDTVGLRDARGRVEVLVSSVRTGIPLRDRHLRDEMQASRYPRVLFDLQEVRSPPGPNPAAESSNAGTHQSVLVGELTIRDSTRVVEVPVTVRLNGDTLAVEGTLPLLLTDYGIDPPSRLLGTARMRNEVELVFDIAFAAYRE